MSDYILRVPSPSIKDRSKVGSTAGDNSVGTDQWLWQSDALLLSTPSRRLGMGWSEESRLRARAVNWIIRISISLQLPQLIIATAAAYLHRFYMRKPLQKFPTRLISPTTLFLATKVEEVPRKLEHVVREYLSVDEDGNERIAPISDSSNDFQVLKQEILYYEDILLRTLCFDLAVDHPYVPLIHSVKLIHESHSRSRSPRPSLSVEMADRAKAKSITQAAWGFVNDSLMTPLCLIARPELIAASAFLLAVSHRLSESPHPADLDLDSPSQDPPAPNHPNHINQLLNFRPRNGPEDPPIQEPWWKAFQVESLHEIYQVANTMLDQYPLSVCDHIRDRASKLVRFPGTSYLCEPGKTVEKRTSPAQSVSEMSLAKQSDQRERWESPVRHEEIIRAVSLTPSRAMMSDNMDLGTPNESPSPSQKIGRALSPAATNEDKPPLEAWPTKRSRSPRSSASPVDDRLGPKNLKLNHPPSIPAPPSHRPPSTPPPPPPMPLEPTPPPPPSSDPPPPNVPQFPSLADCTTKPAKHPVARTTTPTDSSLSDMEDGGLD